MLTEEQAIELGKRAVAAGFRMMPGVMVHYSRDRVVEVRPTALKLAHWMSHWQIITRHTLPGNPYYIPDFRDPATLGTLLAQVRERYGDPTFHAQFDEGFWQVAHWNPDINFCSYWPEEVFHTEAEALVAALEAAKEHKP